MLMANFFNTSSWVYQMLDRISRGEEGFLRLYHFFSRAFLLLRLDMVILFCFHK